MMNALLCATAVFSAPAPLNVLLIAVDDLRTEISPYPEGAHMHTPNLERLAARSVVFERAYVQVAVCMPSRTALLTSRRPDTSRSWTIEPDQYWRKSGGNFSTLPQVFLEQHNYFVCGMGKIFHESAKDSDNQDHRFSWSQECLEPHYQGTDDPGIYDPKGLSPPSTADGKSRVAYRFPDDARTYSQIQDGALADRAVATLQRINNASTNSTGGAFAPPFFLAVGFHKPHIPWYVPDRFFAMYPNDTDVQLAPKPGKPTNAPDIAMQNFIVGECKASDLGDDKCGHFTKAFPNDNTTVGAEAARYMRHAYWAAVSFTDYNVGRVLDALDAGPHANNTIIVLFGDHGYHLGDGDMWAKMTCFEHATRIPLLMSVPGVRPGRTNALVEELDLMPTIIAEATGKAAARCPPDVHASRGVDTCVEGRILSELLPATSGQFGPHQARHFPALPAPPQSSFTLAFSQFPRPEHNQPMTEPDKMGLSVRSASYRYTLWVGWDRTAAAANFSDVYGIELYNHSAAPVPVSYDMESTNIAGEPGTGDIIAQLHAALLDRHQSQGGPTLPPTPAPPVPPAPPAQFTEHADAYCSTAGTNATKVSDKDGVALTDCQAACATDAACLCFEHLNSHKQTCRTYHRQVAVRKSSKGWDCYTRN